MFLMVETIFNLVKVNTVPCMCAVALSLWIVSSWLDSLVPIENITDATNDIEQIENKYLKSVNCHFNSS